MNNYQKYYVYAHTDADNEIVYIGMGQKDRAWTTGATRLVRQEKVDWVNGQLDRGRLPNDWVVILHRHLRKEEAIELERELITDIKPVLNVLHNSDAIHKGLSYSDSDVIEWEELQRHGNSYKEIAKLTGSSTMTVWRALNVNKQDLF